MEELHVMAGPDELGLESYDAQTLMEKGVEAFKADRHEVAARHFERLVVEYPANARVPAALFNLGLCAEKRRDFAGARAVYERVVGEFPKSAEAIDAGFRLGAACMELKQYEDGLRAFRTVGQQDGLSDLDRLEAGVYAGACLMGLNRLADAETEIFHAMSAYRRVAEKEHVENNATLAQGQFYLGEINRLRMEQVNLAFPQDELERSLERKARLLLDAQAQYIKAIRIGSIQWAAASGFRAGGLYETFHQQIVAVPTPSGLSPKEAEAYRGEIHKKMRVLLAKAVSVYEKNIEMAQRVGLTSKWVDETRNRLAKLREEYGSKDAQ
jgi:tetratricopeptide (TPR) repeat protein